MPDRQTFIERHFGEVTVLLVFATIVVLAFVVK